ncbi:MAG TPA: hypothetical protein VKV74_02855 [Bryobacteraceae bacterium]|nr:hypothetical protein [Bryobacteraceae bacterium]
MRRYSIVVMVLACVPVAENAAHAAGVDYFSSLADAVVVGSVPVRVEGPTEVSFSIQIARVLKGNVSGTRASVTHPWVRHVILAPPTVTVTTVLSGLWFLKASSSTAWDVLESRPSMRGSVYGLFLPAMQVAPSGPFAYPPATSMSDALVCEVAAGIQAAPSGSPDADVATLLAAMDVADTPAVRSVLASYLGSTNATYAAAGLAGSLGRAVPGSALRLASLWPIISGAKESSLVVSALRDGWRDSTPASVIQLRSFAAAQPPGDIRAAAVRALAAIHSKETLPFLASLLTSSDTGEQERAIYGISAFANSCPMQTPANVVSMAYLQCSASGPYGTPDTLAHFGFRPGSASEQSGLASYWQAWWDGHPELH